MKGWLFVGLAFIIILTVVFRIDAVGFFIYIGLLGLYLIFGPFKGGGSGGGGGDGGWDGGGDGGGGGGGDGGG